MNGQSILEPVVASSSPSHINSTNGSSVWLHWNYTYIGDGTHNGTTTYFTEQVILFNSTAQSIGQTLAKRTGENGALKLESPVPAPFTGRVEVISSNSTLVIHRVQYNDSTYQFSSNVTVNVNVSAVAMMNMYHLRPDVSITVNGRKILIFLCCNGYF